MNTGFAIRWFSAVAVATSALGCAVPLSLTTNTLEGAPSSDAARESDSDKMSPQLAGHDDVSNSLSQPADESTNWMASSAWFPDPAYDASRASLPIGLQTDTPQLLWRFRPEGIPEKLDLRVLNNSSEPSAVVLLAQVAPGSADWESVRAIAKDQYRANTGLNPFLNKLPYTTQLFSQQAGDESRPSDPQQPLTSEPLNPTLRAAAIEAWGFKLATDRADESRWAELAGIGAGGPAGLSASQPTEVTAEIYRSIGRGVAPTRIPEVAEWLKSDETGVWPTALRRAVLDGCLHFASANSDKLAELDIESLLRLQYDPDTGVRNRAGRLVALTRHDNAIAILQAQARDISPQVRLSAYVSLGMHGGIEALTLLKEAAADPGEHIRAAAVAGMSAMAFDPATKETNRDVISQIVKASMDEAAVVRQSAAKAFASISSPAIAKEAKKLTSDPDRLVQVAAIEAVAHWSDELAVPVLTTAVVDASSSGRLEALRQLRSRTGIKDRFVAEASRDERASAIADWQARYNLPQELPADVTQIAPADTSTLTSAIARLDASPDDVIAWRQIESVAESDLQTLEQLLLERRRNSLSIRWPKLWDEILPAVREDFAALKKLTSSDINERMRGARDLANYSQSSPVSALIESRLVELMTTEQNASVWRDIMKATSGSTGEARDGLLPMALNAAWPDVRMAACEVMAEYPDSSQATWLRPLFNDDNHSVRLAAVKAAGVSGNPSLIDGPDGGLRAKLIAPSQDLRLAAATSMAQLGDSSGMQLLLTLAHSDDVMIRRQAALGINAAAAPSFAAPIFNLAWAERDPTTQDRYLQTLTQLRPEAASDWEQARDYRAKLELWSAASGMSQ